MMDDFKPQRPEGAAPTEPERDPMSRPYVSPVTTSTESSSPDPTEPAPVVTKKKSGVKKWLLGGLVLVLLTGLGAFAYWQWSEAENARSEAATLRTSLEAAQKQNATDTEAATVPAGTGLTDEAAVSAAALDSVEAFMSTSGVTRQSYEATVGYIDDTFARVAVSYTELDPATGKQKPTGKGETFYFKKVERDGGEASWAMIAINPLTAQEMTSLKNRYGVTDKIITEDQPR